MSAAPSSRQRFGRYEVLFPIASGGMAEVFAARALGEAGFSKLVALKRMRPELTDDVKFTTMFLDEGRLAANIASPNVVSTLDLGRAEDNSLYLVMELVTGASLANLLEETGLHQERFDPPIAIEILRQAANGLHDAHEARSPAGEPLGIVHRDVSPHNILVDVNGQVKITDFGIAKALERQTQSHAGEMKGKLSYLSPEQARGREVDRRTDVFILGIVAWEVLTGQRLFDGRGPVEVLHKIATMEIPRVDEVRPELSPAVADAVSQALQRGPAERFSTALAFGNALANAHGAQLPPRSDVGAFVERFGGGGLRELQMGIRRASSGSFDDLPDSEPYPIPLTPKGEARGREPPATDTMREAPAPPLEPPKRRFGTVRLDEMPDREAPADGTTPMAPLDLPEEVRASLDPAASVSAPEARADLGATIPEGPVSADELDLSAARGFPETLPTMEAKIDTVRPPRLDADEPAPAPPTSRGPAMALGLGVLLLVTLAGVALWQLRPWDGPDETSPAVPPVAAEPDPTPEATPEPGPERDGPEEAPTAETERAAVEASGAPETPAEEPPPRPPRVRRHGRAAPEGPPPPRLPGQTDPVGDREAAMEEIFGDEG